MPVKFKEVHKEFYPDGTLKYTYYEFYVGSVYTGTIIKNGDGPFLDYLCESVSLETGLYALECFV